MFPPYSVGLLYAAANEPKELWQVPDCPHGQGRQCAPEEYQSRVVAFWLDLFEISGP